MFYSLLSKFRGAWLGSIFGQTLKAQTQNTTAINCHLEQLSSFREKTKLTVDQQWQLLNQLWENSANNHHITNHFQENDYFSSLILEILPIIVYYHDDWLTIAQLLNSLEKYSFQSQENVDNTLIWCYVVRLALRGKLIIPGLTNCVVMGTGLNTPSIQWLKTVEMSCLNGLTITQLIKQLPSGEHYPFSLSVFCCLQNLDHFWLTLQQASSLENQATNVTALTGFLSGAYNGVTGIPFSKRQLWQDYEFYQQIYQKTEEMIGHWVGMISPTTKNNSLSLITSAQILQPRPMLKIISQQEYESESIK